MTLTHSSRRGFLANYCCRSGHFSSAGSQHRINIGITGVGSRAGAIGVCFWPIAEASTTCGSRGD